MLIIGQQGYTGGVNGITDLRTLLGWDIRTDSAKYILYFVCVRPAARLHPAAPLDPDAASSARILLAMRDKEDRVRFSGYDVANFKIFVFCLAAALSRHRRRDVHAAGRLHVAVLRRHRAVDRDGDLRRGRRAHVAWSARSTARCSSTGARPSSPRASRTCGCSPWAALFIAVVLAFPNGLAGLYARPRRAAARPGWCRRCAPADAGRRPHGTPPTARPPMNADITATDVIGTTEPTDFLLAVEDLTVSFDGFKAIDDLNLYIDKNELRVIIGPNGAGKTTVLDLICGKTKASAGRIKFKDQRADQAARSTRSCARASAASSRRRRSTRT